MSSPFFKFFFSPATRHDDVARKFPFCQIPAAAKSCKLQMSMSCAVKF